MKRIFIIIAGFGVRFKRLRKFILILNWEREKVEAQLISKKISSDNKVLSGPFKNMEYASLNSTGSVLVPKILGSYEDELHGLINKIIEIPYSSILDIGCAEGYYAVGLAMRMPKALIYAYDINKSARNLCNLMALKNGVSERVRLGGKCNSQMLANFDFGKRSLIISDCEGYEKELFQDNCIENLKNCDILIELHHKIHPDIAAYLMSKFDKSHSSQLIESKLKRAKDYPQLNCLSGSDYSDTILLERHITSEWVFFKAR